MDSLRQSNLQTRAHRFALVISLLFAKQELTGKLTSAHRGARHLSLGVKLADPVKLDKALKLAEPLALASGTRAVLAQRVEGQVIYQFELAQGFWQYYYRGQDVTGLTVGLGEQRRPVEFRLDPPHALVCGTTGSGKSEALKSILIALLTTYKPGELQLVLVDPNRDYTDFSNVAHLAMPIASNPQDITRALTWINQELSHRVSEDIKNGNLIIVLIDEAESALFDANLEIAKNIARTGRKYNVHLLAATQKPTEKNLPDLVDKLNNRFVGLVQNAQLSAILTGQAGLDCHKLSGAGDFIHAAGAKVERFQIAMVTKQNYETLPRAEIRPVEVEAATVISLPAEKPKGGRPALEIDPVIAARYFWANPHKVSIAQARELWDLTRGQHELHKSFVIRFLTELQRLRTKQIGAK